MFIFTCVYVYECVYVCMCDTITERLGSINRTRVARLFVDLFARATDHQTAMHIKTTEVTKFLPTSMYRAPVRSFILLLCPRLAALRYQTFVQYSRLLGRDLSRMKEPHNFSQSCSDSSRLLGISLVIYIHSSKHLLRTFSLLSSPGARTHFEFQVVATSGVCNVPIDSRRSSRPRARRKLNLLQVLHSAVISERFLDPECGQPGGRVVVPTFLHHLRHHL